MTRQASTPGTSTPSNGDRLLTINDLAHYLVISRATIYRAINEGSLTHVTVGKRIRFRQTDVDAYLERST